MLPYLPAAFLLATSVAYPQSLLSAPTPVPPITTAVAGSGGQTFFPLGVGVEGDQPMDVVMALGGAVAVVALRDTDSLEFYDVTNGARIGDVKVASGPVDLDPTPDGTTVFVACAGTNRVLAVDVAARAVTASIPCAFGPFQVAALSDNQRAIVACDSGPNAGTLQVVDRQLGQVLVGTATDSLNPLIITTNVGAGTQLPARNEIAVTPDDATVVVPSVFGNSIERFDVSTLLSTGKFSGLGTTPFRAEAAPDASFFAIGSASGSAMTNRVYVVPSNGGGLQEVFVNESGARADVAITPDSGSIVYGTDLNVIKIDVPSSQVVGSAPALTNDGGNIEIDSSGTYAIVGANVVNRVHLSNLTSEIFWQLPTRARIAVHPTSLQVVVVAPLIDEDITSVDLSGNPFGVVWDRALGVPEEIDAPQEVELSPDNGRVVMTCPSSRNVVIADLESGALDSVIDVGGRCLGLAVSPVADLALVCVADMQRLDVVDLVAGQVVQSFTTAGQPQFAFFSPDGSRGMVASSSSGNGVVEFFDVVGASLTSTGQTSVSGVFWSEGHLSPDGTKLAFLDFESIAFVDALSQTTIAQVVSPPIAQDGTWSPDSSRFSWSCNVVQTRVATLGVGAPSVQIYTAPSVTAGATFGPNSTYLYQYVLGDYLRVVELSTGNFLGEVLIGSFPMASLKFRPRWFQTIGDQLLVVRNEEAATVCRVRLAGPNTAVLENLPFPTEGTADVVFDLAQGRLVMPASTAGDGFRTVQFGGDWSVHCGPATPNSKGVPASLQVEGALVAGTEPILLKASDMPSSSFGLFAVSRTPGVSQPALSQGTLCLDGLIVRLLTSIQSTGVDGQLSFEVNPTLLPLPGGVPQVGESLYFQAWFRDNNPTPTSNFTDGVQVTLR